MPIENRDLTPGTILAARYRKAEHRCTVEQNEDGTLAFVLQDGRRFKSPSAAGSAVMAGGSCNGWRFWSLDGTLKPVRTSTIPTETETEAKPKGKSGRTTKLIKRMKSQAGVAEGIVRWFCGSCMRDFSAAADETPTACPEGRGAEPTDTTAA